MKIHYIAAIVVVTSLAAIFAWRKLTVEYLHDVQFVRNGERVCSTDNSSCRYLEYSKDETFENVDEWSFLKFNSSDVHRQIVGGQTCSVVKVSGIRFPFFSIYRNIIYVSNCK